MARTKKRGPGRPSLGERGRSNVVAIKFSRVELDAIAEAVAQANASGADTTVSSWIRDHALKPLGMATFDSD